MLLLCAGSYDVYVLNGERYPALDDNDIMYIKLFVEDGGGLIVAGQSWYWSYSNPDITYPTNQYVLILLIEKN